MKETLKVTGIIAVMIFTIIGFSFFISAWIYGYGFNYSVTGDFVARQTTLLDKRVNNYKDSCLKYVNKPEIYNKYVDSANKYSYIFNYLIKTK